MPNLSTHPVRSPRNPRQGYVGEVAHSTLENAAVYNPDILRSKFYQDGYQRFAKVSVDRSHDTEIRVRRAVEGSCDLESLRKLYGEILDGRGVLFVETRLVKLLRQKLDKVIARSIKEAFDAADADSVEALLADLEGDPLLAALVITIDLQEVKEKLPALRESQTTKERGRLDEGGGGRRKSSAMLSRRSCVSETLFSNLRQAKIKVWDHVTFNAETGRLGILKDIVFDKRKSIYRKDVPDAEYADPDEVREVLEEVVEIWEIFQVRVTVVQAHKAPYASKMADGGDHDDWMQTLALRRAEKVAKTLEELGIPRDMMTPQVHVVSSTPTMQYLQFEMDTQHTDFVYADGLVNLKTDLPFARRKFYDGGHSDDPRAEIADPSLASEILQEVVRIWSVYKCDMDIVVLREPVVEGARQEHLLWLHEVMEYRGTTVLQELVGLGIPRERLASRCGDAADREEAGAMRFELLREMRSAPATPTAPVSLALVEGCGQLEFNGSYKPVGTQNGQVRYRHVSCGKPTLCFGSDKTWHLCYNFDPTQSFYTGPALTSATRWRTARRDLAIGLLPTVRVVQAPPEGKPSTLRSNASFRSEGQNEEVTLSMSRKKSVSGLSDVQYIEADKVADDSQSAADSADGQQQHDTW